MCCKAGGRLGAVARPPSHQTADRAQEAGEGGGRAAGGMCWEPCHTSSACGARTSSAEPQRVRSDPGPAFSEMACAHTHTPRRPRASTCEPPAGPSDLLPAHTDTPPRAAAQQARPHLPDAVRKPDALLRHRKPEPVRRVRPGPALRVPALLRAGATGGNRGGGRVTMHCRHLRARLERCGPPGDGFVGGWGLYLKCASSPHPTRAPQRSPTECPTGCSTRCPARPRSPPPRPSPPGCTFAHKVIGAITTDGSLQLLHSL